MRGWFGVRNVDQIFEVITHSSGLELPAKIKDKRRLFQYFVGANADRPLQIYVGSCPDYAHDGCKYTHTGIGGGVPLLTQYHLQANQELLQELHDQQIPYQYTVMVADVEAVDEIFCNRFTEGDEKRFLSLCSDSVKATAELMAEKDDKSRMISSSFFKEFGRERFLSFQGQYSEVLKKRFESDGSFHTRVMGDLIARKELYRKMYPEIYRGEVSMCDRDEFLVGRTIRTMAQYLTLGRLIAERSEDSYPVIICHATRNIGLFNERNKFLLPSDRVHPQPTIPIIKMKKEVY